MRFKMRAASGIPALLAATCPAPVFAHGIAGDRFFPATLATDDPAVADELSLPTVGRFKTSDVPAATEMDVAGEYSKRLTKQLGLSIAGTWIHQRPEGGPSVSGFDNLETTLKYQFLTSARHEAIIAAGVSVDWGGTGASRVGAETIGTVTPSLYFGKGAGDLPSSVGWARPFALTGVIGYSIPTRGDEFAEDPECPSCATMAVPTTRSVQWGGTLQYSLRYLASQVKDLGFPTWVNQLTPLVEVAATTPVANARGERTTGTINPGVIWSGRNFQLGLEAQIPMNRDSGRTVGALVQVHWFIDDLFPHSLGRPIW